MEPGLGKNSLVDGFHKSYQPTCQKTNAFGLKSSGAMTEKHHKIRDSLQEYGNNASFHGLRFVTDPLASKLRRFIWCCLLLACVAVLVYQIVDRVTHFYSYPVTVNVKVNYNTTLEFPAVTICNQNAFKATLSASLGRYRLIEKMYTEPETFSQDDIREFSAENVSLADLYLQSSHKKEDFIFRSSWKGKSVNETDIHTLATDHGVCYTFKNTGANGFVTSPGVENGLRLTLNIEQYEYMPGPHDAAGIKMLLHDRDEIPRVHALGQAIPPGSHVFVGVKIVEVTNLPLPHGSCLDKTLEYSDVYTTEACQLDCLTRRASQICGCRSLFMPHKNGFPPICTLEEYYGCLQNVLESFPVISAKLCECPVPCYFRLYETDISYASTSAYTLNKFLSDGNKQKLSKKLSEASEVTSRYEIAKFSKIQKLNDRLKSNMNKLNQRVIINLRDTVHSAIIAVKERYEEIENHFKWKDYLYNYQAYILQKNFMRARDAYEERTLHIVALGYAEYIMKIESRIRRLSNGDLLDASTREMLFEDTSDLLSNRKKIIETALVNFTTLKEAYDSGIQIFNYKYFDTPRSHNIPAAPKLLIKESRVHNSYAVKYGNRFERYLNETLEILDFCQMVVDEAFNNKTLDESNMTECRETFRYLMRNWVFARSVFYFDTIDWPLKKMEERLKDFDIQWNELRNVYDNLYLGLNSLQSDIEMFETSTYNKMIDISDAIEGYLNGTVTMANVSNVFTSKTFRHLVTSFDQFFQHIRSKESSVSDWLRQMSDDAYRVLELIVNDQDSWEYYNFTGKTEYLRNISDIGQILKENYTLVANLLLFSDAVNGSDSDISSVYDDLVQEMTEYKDSLIIDSSFIKDNFLHVDIFYRQMSYEEIHQQKAYEMFSLWCDIGGTMGLFLGASFLSVVEVVDFILTHLSRGKKTSQDPVKKIFL